MRRLEEDVFVAGQVDPGQIAQLAEQGIALIINNRPDGEEPGQPDGAAIAAAAAAAGIDYRHIPVAQLTPEAIEATEEALREPPGPVLAFCRSGTRSTYLWALARSRQGLDREAIIGAAGAAGYDLTPIARFLR